MTSQNPVPLIVVFACGFAWTLLANHGRQGRLPLQNHFFLAKPAFLSELSVPNVTAIFLPSLSLQFSLQPHEHLHRH
jgi:hypothetical protein